MRTVYVRAALTLGAVIAATACTPTSGRDPNGGVVGPSAEAVSLVHAATARTRLPVPASLEGPYHMSRLHPGRGPSTRRGGPKDGPDTFPAVTYLGGPLVTSPKVVPVIFPGNPFEAQIRDFLQKLSGSDYWRVATSEYGVGPITTLPAYVPTDPPPDLFSLSDWIGGLATNPPPGLPPADANTIYAIVFPPGWGSNLGVCRTFGGLHSAQPLSPAGNAIFTVNPTCLTPYNGQVGLEFITAGLSHEIEEAATDPLGTGYYGVNWQMSGWASAAEFSPTGENADMCEFQPDAYYVDPQLGYNVQRIWSNRASAGGHDPCQPIVPGTGPYFTAEPVISEGTKLEAGFFVLGATVNVGSETTIPVRLRADGPVGEWQLSAHEGTNPHPPGDPYNELSFSWDVASGRAGDTRYLTIRRTPPAGGERTTVFLRVAIDSTLGSVTHRSWLIVGTD